MPPSIITLTTDFGTRDGYVASMKGRILSRCPEARLVDISHEIPPQDVMAAAFVLREAAKDFPGGTIHLAVVDPGVGTARRAVAVRHAVSGARAETGTGRSEAARPEHCFVGPDNGLISLVLGTSEPERAIELDDPAHWAHPGPSSTFHGRDIFAPVAGSLARGIDIRNLGTPVDRLRTLRWVEPTFHDDGISAWIAHIDRFGNAITNVSAGLFRERLRGRAFKAHVGAAKLTALSATYADVEQGEPVLLVGSHGFLEVAVRQGNASELLSIRQGAPVHLVFDSA